MRALAIVLIAAASMFGQSGAFPPPAGGGGGGSITAVNPGAGLAGGGSSGAVSLRLSQSVNSQTGTTYTYLNSDCGKLVVHSNAGSIAGALPQAGGGGSFASGCVFDVLNLGAGTLTITPTTSTVNGGATLVLLPKQVARVVSDGTNYSAGAPQNATQLAGVTPGAGGLSILDDADATAIRSTLGLVIGTNVQAFDTDLNTYAGITPAANVQSLLGAADYAAMRTLLSLVVGTNVQAFDADLTTYAGITPSANVQSLLGAANYSAMRTLLSLVPGTDVQAVDAELTCLAGLTSAADKIPYFTGSGTCALGDLSSAMRTFMTTPSSANWAAVISNESGSGAALFGTQPTIDKPVLTPYTVATLPTPASGMAVIVTDGNTGTDCASGGGSNRVWCRYNGSAWEAIASSAGSGTVNTGAAGCVAYYPSAATTVDDAQNSANCALKFDSTNNRLEFYDTSNTLTIRIDATAGTIETFGTASETIMTDLGADPSAPGAGKTAFYTKSGMPKYIANGGSAQNIAIGDSAGAASAVVNGAVTNAKLGANAVDSSKMAVVNTRRVCDLVIGDTSGSVLTNAQLGPQKRMCFIPAASTVVEIDVAADGGTPNVIVAKNSAGSVSNLVSSALATAASGGIACSKTGATSCIDGVTTASATLQNTSLAAGDYIELVSGTAGGTAKLMTVHVVYTVN